MTWPAGSIPNTNVDSGTDNGDPSAARADFKATIDQFNQLVAHVHADKQALLALPKYGFSVTNSASQALTGGDADVQFDTESYTGSFDHGTVYNAGTYEFTAPVAGVYQFNVNLRTSMSGAGDCYLSVSIHAGVSYATARVVPGQLAASSNDSVNYSGCLLLAAGDKVKIRAGGSATGNISGGSSGSSWSGFLVYPT